MADNPAPAAQPAPNTRRMTWLDVLDTVATLSTYLAIGAMLWVPYSTMVDPSGKVLRWVLEHSAHIWLTFIFIQVLESASRDFDDAWGLVKDSILAVLAVFIGLFQIAEVSYIDLARKWTGIGLLDLLPRAPPLTSEQLNFIWQAALANAFDFVTGLFIPFVIAASIRARSEHTRG